MKNLFISPFLYTLNRVLFLLSFLIITQVLHSQTTRPAGTYTELTNAITASADGDIINITNHIVVTAQVANTKTITINGNGFVITVPNTGLDDAGRFNSTTSAFRVFAFSGSGKTTTINNLIIKGGLVASNGGAITVSSDHILRLNNSTISNSRVSAGGGGGLYNAGGVVYIYNCEVIRNASNYGGGFLNSSGTIYVEHSTLSENRSTSSSGGGGAGENSGFLYINNSTFANNKSTEIGGAINNYGGNIYAINSSFTGNVAYGDYQGGAIGNNGGSVWAVNSLFAYNYTRSGGTVAAPSAYTLDDVDAYDSPENVHLYYCILHSTTLTGIDQVIGNVNYTGADNGSDNSIFSGGALAKITNGTGFEIGTASVFLPFLFNNSGGIAPTLKTGSFTLQPGNRGTPTRFDNDNDIAPKVAYYDRTTSTWVNLLNTPTAGNDVLIDQVATTRSNPPAIGAIESPVDNLFMLKVNASADGAVNGGSIYGDVYISGAQVDLAAIPNASRQFVRWDYVLGGSGTASTNNPYTVTVDRDITLVPIFQTVSAGNYSITYAGNDNTGGTAPSSGNFSAPTTIETKGALKKAGYIFNGWNTNSNGSGTNYAAGAAYSTGTNLTLYAKWTENFWRGTTSNGFVTTTNWGAGIVPATNEDIVFANDAVNDLVLDQDRQIGDLIFSIANFKVKLGNFNLTSTGVTGYNSTRYVQTGGTGKLKMNVADAQQKIFPAGNSNFNPVTITNKTGSADDFDVQVLDEVYANSVSGTIVGNTHITSTWNIGKTTANAGSGVDLLFEWQTGQEGGVVTPALFHYGGSSWVQQTMGTASAIVDNRFSYSDYTGNFSPFYVGSDATLPLKWESFTAQKQQNNVLLQWQTAEEQNTKDFIVQHSKDGVNWTDIGTVIAVGNGNNYYHFTHSQPTNGDNNYRVLQRDLDNRATYSMIRKVQWKAEKGSIILLANPIQNGRLAVQLAEPQVLRLFANDGRLVWQERLSAGVHHIDISHLQLAQGMYTLRNHAESVRLAIARK